MSPLPRINILSPFVADLIAAGEVVERPASVVKELLENAVDAGARNVTVELRGGGREFIRVTDDGCGMSPEDAGIAFLRHATSKLQNERGLEAIGTLGFRGEALAAISSVSHIELATCERGADLGVRMKLDAGEIVDMYETGCPSGTTMIVRGLFYNTPARLKFMKSDRSEGAACVQAALRCALGRPDISFRCIKDGAEEFFTPGDGREESAVYALLGRETARGMLPVSGKGENMAVTGFTSSPAFGRGNRANQHFYCNGRYIKSVLLQSAGEQADKNTLLTGKFPSCVLYLELSRGAVDVNVHPAKTEVKFSEEKKVFDLVYQTVRACLEAGEKPIEITLSEGTRRAVSAPKPEFFRSMSAEEYRAKAASSSPAKPPASAPAPRREERPAFRAPAAYPAPEPPQKDPVLPKIDKNPLFSPAPERKNVEKSVENVEKISAPACRVIGEALDTYILAEIGDELMLIDKHAAHERMIFDRLKAQNRQIMSQTLLAPVIIRPTAEDAEIIEKNAALLDEMGFEVEPFGEESFAVRSVPDDVDVSEAASALEEICQRLREGGEVSAGSARDEILHTVACKAAIKAGRRHDIAELERIACAVASGEVKYCPHGRPVSARLSKKQLDKFFSRIV